MEKETQTAELLAQIQALQAAVAALIAIHPEREVAGEVFLRVMSQHQPKLQDIWFDKDRTAHRLQPVLMAFERQMDYWKKRFFAPR